MLRIFQLLLLCCLVLTGPSPSLRAEETGGERLVPAALGVRTDRTGTSWNVEPNGTIGRIGSTMVNSGLALSLDGEPFSGFQPMMTSDGKEFVIPGRPFVNLPGIQVQRRIRLLEDEGVLRYAEMLYNGSTDPVQLTLSLSTNFSGNYQTFLTNRGRSEPVLLEPSESSIVVLPGVAQSTRAFLFVLADENSEIKPTLSAQNRYGLNFQYPVSIAPGQTRIILHQVAQVVIPQNFDRPTLLKRFRPYSFAETAKYLPEKWSSYLVNSGGGAGAPALVSARSFGLDSLGIEAGSRDVLAIGEKTRLLGKASGGAIALSSPYGEATIPFQRLAAIRGKGGSPVDESRIFLKDGQVFSGNIEVPTLEFSQTGGDKIELEVDSLDRLVIAAGEAPADSEDALYGIVETYRGDRIKVAATDSISLEGLTPWGRLPVKLSNLIRLGPAPGGQHGHWIELEDGTRCVAFLSDSDLNLDSALLGDIELSAGDLRSIFSPESKKRGRWDSEIGIRTVVQIAGSQRLVGEIGNSTLPVVSGGVRIDTATTKVRRIERLRESTISPGGIPEATPSFEIERWDGGILTGFIDLDVISLKVQDQSWKVPLRDIVKIETPSPELTPDALSQMAALLEQLGAADWGTREKATLELGAFGYLASPVLRQHLRTSGDPEVNRRIERILSGLN